MHELSRLRRADASRHQDYGGLHLQPGEGGEILCRLPDFHIVGQTLLELLVGSVWPRWILPGESATGLFFCERKRRHAQLVPSAHAGCTASWLPMLSLRPAGRRDHIAGKFGKARAIVRTLSRRKVKSGGCGGCPSHPRHVDSLRHLSS